jgi:hypothetical protein
MQLRIAEKEKVLMHADDHIEMIDLMVGMFRTGMSGLPTRIAGPDLRQRLQQWSPHREPWVHS